MYYQYLKTPLGWLEIRASGNGVTHILFVETKELLYHPSVHTEVAASQLDEYFLGRRRIFDLPIDIRGTSFQKSVWRELLAIAFGQTISYSQIAKKIGNPKAVRAVGGAGHCNPLSIVAACHRVIGADGKLTGYAGGLDKKAWLLQHEKNICLQMTSIDDPQQKSPRQARAFFTLQT